MKAKTLTALKDSIRKWTNIVKGTGVDKGTSNCPLCEMFYRLTGDYDENCEGCPVAKKTGSSSCFDTDRKSVV